MKKNNEINNNEVNEVVSLAKKILKLLYIVMIVAIVLCGTIILKNLNILNLFFTFLKVLAPLFIGFVIAWLFNPIVNKMHNKGIPRIVGSLIVYAVLLVFIYVFLRILIPTLYTQINDLMGTLPAILDKFNAYANDFVKNISVSGIDLTKFKDNLFNSVGNSLVDFTNSMPNSIINIIGNLFSGIGTLLISLVVGLYMLFDFDHISKHFLKLVPNKNKYEIEINKSIIIIDKDGNIIKTKNV